MPRRDDLDKVLVIGSGPIVIGQACEFDYSGTQACRVLSQEGYRIVLANSNPATIMTDPEFADATYVEPITPEHVTAIIERERPDAFLPTLGGQTGLNVAMELARRGVFERYGVEMIGANREAIRRAEDRSAFKQTMTDAGLDVPRSAFAYSLDEALQVAEGIGYPVVVRPSYVLGGAGRALFAPPKSSPPSRRRACGCPRSERFSSRNPSRDGRNSSSSSCATETTTSWSCARSRTSIRWACTPGTPSPSHRP